VRRLAALAAVLSLALGAAPAPAVNDAAILSPDAPTVLPTDLSTFGFFRDGAGLTPAEGVTPYRLNTPLWSDGAEKLRFLYLPKGVTARAQGEGLLDLPVGAALVKSFAFAEAGQNERRGQRLIETRVLLHRAGGWVAASYQWDAAQTSARLVPAGARVLITTPAGEAISYKIPNRNQCKECHALDNVMTPIGPKARNLSAAWLDAQHRAGKLAAVPAVAHRLPLWEEANCAYCHNARGAASNSGLWLGWDEADPVRLGLRKPPVAAGRGSGSLAYDVAPGNPEGSILVHRMASTEPGVAMPEIGRSSVDKDGLEVIRAWIKSLR
jgi:cytochrome c551/c552